MNPKFSFRLTGLLVASTLPFGLFAQQVVQIVEQQSIVLKGETKAMFGAKARTSVEVVLPENTIKWYYAYSASDEAAMKKDINLRAEVEKAMAASGVEGMSADQLKAPDGNLAVDILVCNSSAIKDFVDKEDAFGMSEIGYEKNVSSKNRRNAVIEVVEPKAGTWYLGLANTNSMESAKITFEVVAIVGGAGAAAEGGTSEKSKMYGNLAWKKIEAGEYGSAIDYADKALGFGHSGSVKATKALAMLLNGNEAGAIETYIDAIVMIKRQEDAKAELTEQLNRVNKMTSGKSVSGSSEVKDLIQIELDQL